MADRWTRVEPSTPPGPLWLMVDPPTTHSAGDSRRCVPLGWPPAEDFTGQLVHLISDHARGEVRGYWLIDGELWHRFPGPTAWPEADVLVCLALGVPVPERMAGARALAAGADVRLVVEADQVCRIDVRDRERVAAQLGMFGVSR